MRELSNIKTMMWIWMAGYALVFGVMVGVTLGLNAYGQIHFNVGAMVLTMLVTFPLLAPMQLWLNVATQVVREQEAQTQALLGLLERSAPTGAITTTAAVKTSATAKTTARKVAPVPAPVDKPARSGWKSPFA